MTIELPLTDKAGVTFNFVGADTEPPVVHGSRKTHTVEISPARTAALSTSSDIGRLRIQEADETGLTTSFKSASLTIDNAASPAKVLGTLGAHSMNFGNFNVNLTAEILFSDSGVIDAIRNNATVTMDFAVRNDDDGGIHFDIPSMTLGDGSRSLPVDETVQVTLTGQAFADDTLDTSLGVSFFPFVPAE
jgi:hypothetical protein